MELFPVATNLQYYTAEGGSLNDIYIAGMILGLRPANERRRYSVTTSLIGWAQAQNQPCIAYTIPHKNHAYGLRYITLRHDQNGFHSADEIFMQSFLKT